jgi:hypothetical protein
MRSIVSEEDEERAVHGIAVEVIEAGKVRG